MSLLLNEVNAMKQIKIICEKYIWAVDRLNILLKIVSGFLFCLLVVLIFLSVMSRFMFNFSFAFIEQAAAYIAVWMVMMGLPLTIRAGSMMAIELIYSIFKGKLTVKFIKTLVGILSIVFFAIMIRAGILFVEIGAISTSSTLPWIRLSWVYLSIPLGAIFMILNTFANTIEHWHKEDKAVC